MENRISARQGPDVASFFLAVVFLGFVILLVAYFADYGNWFIHPHQFEIHLPKLLADGTEFRLRSLANIFQQFDPSENRPRFLSYAIISLNLHLRMWLYEWFVLYPPFSLGWIFELLAAPLLLFIFIRNVGNNLAAACSGVIVYVTSIGFLSGFAMPLLPGKPLTNFIFVAILWLSSEAKKKAEPGQMLHEVRGGRATMLAVGIVLLAGLFLDEVPLFGFLLPLIFYPELFFPRKFEAKQLARAGRSWMPLAIPPAVFLLVVVVIVPVITQKAFGFKFNYLESVFVNREAAQFGKTFFSGPDYGFGLQSLGSNAISLFGSALVPWKLAPLLKHPSGGGGVITSMTANAITVTATAAFILGSLYLGFRSRTDAAIFVRRAILTAVLFVLFMSLLQGRHVPFIIGYVYGCAFPVFLAIAAGLAVAAAPSRPLRVGLVLLALFIACVQLVNFHAINRSWVQLHNEGLTKPAHQKDLPIAQDGRVMTRREVNAIWTAWKDGDLENYLRANSISSGAVFLIFELRYLDKWRMTKR